MKLLLYLLAILPFTNSAASPIDSLLAALITAQDTAKVNLLNELGEAYRYQDIGKGTYYLDSALQITKAIQYTRGEAQAYLNLGAIAIIQGDTEHGVAYTQEALALFNTLSDQSGIANANKNLGVLAYFMGDYGQAKEHYQEALSGFSKVKDTQGQAKCYANLGLVSMMYGAFDKALGYFMKSLRCNELLNNQEGIASDYVYMAQVSQQINNLSQALQYQEKALDIFRSINNKVREAHLLCDIGKTYHLKQQWSEALTNYRLALTLQKQLGSTREMGTTLGNIGAVYEEMDQPQQAAPFYQQSLSMARKAGNERNVPVLLNNLAELAIKQSKYDTAARYLDQSITLAKRLGQKSDLQLAHDLFYQMYKDQNRYRQALEQYQVAREYQDSLFDEEKAKQMTELQTRYDVEKKERQIASQEQKIALLDRTKQTEKRLRLVLIVALTLLFLLMLFIYSRYRLKQRSAQLLDEKNREIQEKNSQISRMNQELEKRMLRAQMDPHFIFNSLNSIQHFITINDKTSALKYLSKFSKLVRRVLESSVNTQVPIADEITLLKLYIELERLRYSHSFDYSIQIDESVDVHETEIPFLLIQPYVENALVHGLRHKAGGGHLSITLKQEGAYLICVVEDNGIGRTEAKRRKAISAFPSRGMSVTQQRLETLNEGQAEKTNVRILDLKDCQGTACGTRVEIFIPQTEELCLEPSL